MQHFPGMTIDGFGKKFFLNAWQAVRHQKWIWGYPVSLETVTLIYNKRLLEAIRQQR
jgi:maltose-binding protein MalE